MSHENTITIGVDDRFYNIPTVVGGKQRSESEAVGHFKRAGHHFGSFRKLEGALFSARERSREGHRKSGRRTYLRTFGPIRKKRAGFVFPSSRNK